MRKVFRLQKSWKKHSDRYFMPKVQAMPVSYLSRSDLNPFFNEQFLMCRFKLQYTHLVLSNHLVFFFTRS